MQALYKRLVGHARLLKQGETFVQYTSRSAKREVFVCLSPDWQALKCTPLFSRSRGGQVVKKLAYSSSSSSSSVLPFVDIEQICDGMSDPQASRHAIPTSSLHEALYIHQQNGPSGSPRARRRQSIGRAMMHAFQRDRRVSVLLVALTHTLFLPAKSISFHTRAHPLSHDTGPTDFISHGSG